MPQPPGFEKLSPRRRQSEAPCRQSCNSKDRCSLVKLQAHSLRPMTVMDAITWPSDQAILADFVTVIRKTHAVGATFTSFDCLPAWLSLRHMAAGMTTTVATTEVGKARTVMVQTSGKTTSGVAEAGTQSFCACL